MISLAVDGKYSTYYRITGKTWKIFPLIEFQLILSTYCGIRGVNMENRHIIAI